MIRRLAPFEPEFIEQPVSSLKLEALVQVRDAVGVPLAADQFNFTPADVYQTCVRKAADVIVLGLHETGGILEFRKAAAIAEAGRPRHLPARDLRIRYHHLRRQPGGGHDPEPGRRQPDHVADTRRGPDLGPGPDSGGGTPSGIRRSGPGLRARPRRRGAGGGGLSAEGPENPVRHLLSAAEGPAAPWHAANDAPRAGLLRGGRLGRAGPRKAVRRSGGRGRCPVGPCDRSRRTASRRE